MAWWLRISTVLPREAESGAPEPSPPHTPPLSVDSDLDFSSDDSSLLSTSLQSLGEVPEPCVELRACIMQCIEDHLPSTMEPPSPPHPRPVQGVIVSVAEAVPSHRLDSSEPVPGIMAEPAAQVVAGLDHDVEEDGRRQDGIGEEEILEPAPSLQSAEPPQQDTGHLSPTLHTRGRSQKQRSTTFNLCSLLCCFRSRRRVGVLVGEADHRLDLQETEPVPAAQGGWLQRFLRRFRRTARKR